MPAESASPEARLRRALLRHTPLAPDTEPALQAALAHLAVHPGKLLRAQLVFAGARHHGLSTERAERLACAVEFFHVASLVLDDLPCMDDAVLRRGQPCVHRQHGEATAILSALALINRAYALARGAFAAQPRRVRAAADGILERSLGTAGLVGGQAWDLAFLRTDRSPRTASRIAAAKTGALFSLAVALPAALARPTPAERRRLRALCVYWGQQYQIADDLQDILATSAEAGKSTQRDRGLARPNLAHAIGVPAARSRIERLHVQGRRTVDELVALGHARWHYLPAFLNALAPRLGPAPTEETAAA